MDYQADKHQCQTLGAQAWQGNNKFIIRNESELCAMGSHIEKNPLQWITAEEPI
jgi:hypothetical protein